MDGGSHADTQHVALDFYPVFGGVGKNSNSEAAEFPGGFPQESARQMCFSAKAGSLVSPGFSSLISLITQLSQQMRQETRDFTYHHACSAHLPLTTPDSRGPVTWLLTGAQATGMQQGILQKQLGNEPPEGPKT